MKTRALLLVVAVLSLGCKPKEAELTAEMMKAEYSWDLGPETIDIYAYSDEQKQDYFLFKERCSRCHTLARPINAPFASRENWKEYVQKMNKRSGSVLLGVKEEKRLIEFLVFDASQRKIKPEFQAEASERDALFERVKKAKAALAGPKKE